MEIFKFLKNGCSMVDFFLKYIFIIRFFRYFRKNLFAQALATLPKNFKYLVAHQHYALYRLGMYRSVAAEEPVVCNWRSFFSIIVSLAAIGERENAFNYLKDPLSLKLLESKKKILCKALISFVPDQIDLLISLKPTKQQRIALLLAQNNYEKAKLELDYLRSQPKLLKAEPDIFLLFNNASDAEAKAKLCNLNAYLKTYGLLPAVLKDITLPPGAMNLTAVNNLPPSDGPLVSILMTTYASASRIVPAIESLLEQTYANIEVVVIDDASPDETAQLVHSIQDRDKRVRYVRLPVNVGTYAAKTIGLIMAKGKFITCHDSDDWAHPEKIALQMQPLLNDDKIVFTTSQMVRVSDDGYFYARQIYPLTRLNSSSVLFRKQVVLDRCGAWDLVKTGADSEFLARLKIVFGSHAMRRINKPLSFCAHRPDSLMTQAVTGYDENRISPMRLDYWESFSAWHIDCLREGVNPKFSNDILRSRVFYSPVDNLVSVENLKKCIEYLDIGKMLK